MSNDSVCRWRLPAAVVHSGCRMTRHSTHRRTRVNIGLLGILLLVLLSGCGGNDRALALCHSVHENTVLFDKVLIGGQPASRFPEHTLTPISRVTRELGKPDAVLYLHNPLFSWWRYGNTAYMVASLSASQPGHDYLAAKSCDWKYTQERSRAILRGY